MNTRTTAAVLALAIAAWHAPASVPGERGPAATNPITWEYGVMVPVRDGVRLATDVFRPAVPGRFPVVITRTPYGRADERDFAVFFASHGYVALTQDVRGRYDSEGEWYPFVHEADDGYDVQEWAARQPWSNGQVLGYGSSYGAIQQWLSATRRSPHLVALSPQFTPSDPYAGMVWVGGAFQEAIALTWSALVSGRVKQSASLKFDPWPAAFRHLPVADALRYVGHTTPFYRDWLAHPTRDAYWRAVSWRDDVASIDVPVFVVGSWFDIFNVGYGNTDCFQTLRKRGPARYRAAHRLVIGPWEHGPHGTRVGEIEFGPQSTVDLDAMLLRWYDHFVKGVDNGAEMDPAVRVFTMGENAWHDYDDWPVPGTRPVSYYLRGGGRANGASGDGRLEIGPPPSGERSDLYAFDPADPVPNAGGGNCCWPELLPWGPFDQRAVERRDDVLVYSTPPLEKDLRVTGRITARLWVASSAPDTDFTVKLVDVFPNGFAMNLTDGILRTRYRASFETPLLLAPGTPVEITVEAGDTSNLFRAGHQLRVEIASANFPRYSRNTNTGGQPETEISTTVAHQVVLHDAAHPSRVEIPVLP